MKTNSLRIVFFLAGLSLGGVTRLAAANASAPADPASTAPIPANPFGPKPVEPVQPPASTSQPASDNTPLSSEQFVAQARQMLLVRFDKNKDGVLDVAEFAEAQVLFSDGRGRRAGQDGVVPAGPLFGLRPQIMRNLGKGNNDPVTTADIAKLHAFLFGAAPESSKPDANAALRQAILNQFDKNGDGKLNDAELAAAKAQLQLIFAELSKPSTDSKHATSVPAATATPAK